jgi:tetratricopeptide (TPR) repeat protein
MESKNPKLRTCFPRPSRRKRIECTFQGLRTVKAIRRCSSILALVLLIAPAAQAEVRFALNLALQEEGEHDGNQRTAALHIRAGVELAAQEKLSAAAEEFVKALALDPKSAEAHYNLGLVRMKWGDLDSAIKSFRVALQLRPEYSLAQLRLANALTQLARDDERYVDEAIAAYRQALRLEPEEPEAHFNLGFLAMRRLDYRTATEEYEKTLSLNPQYPGLELALCVSVYKLGDFPRADSLCRKAVIRDPGSAPAHHYLGLVMSKREAWQPAVQELRAAIRLDPSDYQMHYALAQALRKAGQPDEATAELESVRRMQARSTEDLREGFLESQTRKMLDAGEVDRAIENYRQSFKLKQDARGATNLGSALLWKGNTDEAMHVLEQALQIDPGYAWAHYYLGVAWARRREFEKGVASLTKALNLRPDFPEAEFYLGLCLAGQGKLQDAETHLRSAVAMRPDTALAHHYLGLVLEQLGRHKESADELQTARLLDSNYQQNPNPADANGVGQPAASSAGTH